MIKSFKIFENKNDLNQQLIDAVENDDLDKVKELINLGADIETKDKYGDNSLNISVWNGFFDIARYLIEHGINVKDVDKYGHKPMMVNKTTFWSTKKTQEVLLKQNPMNISLLKKHDIPIHPDIKEEHYDLDLGSELGTI